MKGLALILAAMMPSAAPRQIPQITVEYRLGPGPCAGLCFEYEFTVRIDGGGILKVRDTGKGWRVTLFQVDRETRSAFIEQMDRVRPDGLVREGKCMEPPWHIEWMDGHGGDDLVSCDDGKMAKAVLEARRALRLSVGMRRLVSDAEAAAPDFF